MEKNERTIEMPKDANPNLTADDSALLEKARAKAARAAELAAKREEARNARAGESKADAFKRIGIKRTNSALDAIATLRGLASKANYDYTADQAAKIVAALRAGVDKVESDFASGGKVKNEEGISL